MLKWATNFLTEPWARGGSGPFLEAQDHISRSPLTAPSKTSENEARALIIE
jgi:hypothetical protein